ncbi:MAG: ATP-binding protein [Bacteroidaceae bacterium]|nr:ATP-binding protein [Bacteroidaceae bacterium]
MIQNPFILYGYESAAYFCDREKETAELKRLLANGNNVALIAPRRIGKTGLIQHLFHQPDVATYYYTFLIDIYATKNMGEMIMAMGSNIMAGLRSKGTPILKKFTDFLSSLRTGISFDALGNPSWNVEIGDVRQPNKTLEEIFKFLEAADKPCIVAIDEFQTVSEYRDANAEAVLRTFIQHCKNTHFIFAGSQRTMMGEIFLNPARPFYQSTAMMNIECIPLETYTDFCVRLFEETGRSVETEVIKETYQRFEGITWYMQRIMNELFAVTLPGNTCQRSQLEDAVSHILRTNEFTYQSILYQLPSKQKELLVAICKEGKASNLTSADFIHRYRLTSASSVQSAIKGLIEKRFVTMTLGTYEVYDKFFAMWLLQKNIIYVAS